MALCSHHPATLHIGHLWAILFQFCLLPLLCACFHKVENTLKTWRRRQSLLLLLDKNLSPFFGMTCRLFQRQTNCTTHTYVVTKLHSLPLFSLHSASGTTYNIVLYWKTKACIYSHGGHKTSSQLCHRHLLQKRRNSSCCHDISSSYPHCLQIFGFCLSKKIVTLFRWPPGTTFARFLDVLDRNSDPFPHCGSFTWQWNEIFFKKVWLC